MNELKTLKDIKHEKLATYKPNIYYNIDDLRQTAREWISYLEYAKYNCGCTEELEAWYNGQISAFKHFFNLEDE